MIFQLAHLKLSEQNTHHQGRTNIFFNLPTNKFSSRTSVMLKSITQVENSQFSNLADQELIVTQ